MKKSAFATMLAAKFRQVKQLRPFQLQLRPARNFSTKAHLETFVNSTNWYGKVAGAVIGASGLLVCMFGVRDAFAKDEKKKRVVVLGSGWGAVSFLKNLRKDLYDVVVVSPTNYFIFTPFLASVTVGTIEARTICEPIRKILNKRHKGSHFYEAECTDIDAENKKIVCVKENEGRQVNN